MFNHMYKVFAGEIQGPMNKPLQRSKLSGDTRCHEYISSDIEALGRDAILEDLGYQEIPTPRRPGSLKATHLGETCSQEIHAPWRFGRCCGADQVLLNTEVLTAI
ncbi:hypothetical protein PMIN06_012430 [Paraphaeosphaeria minitans]